MRPRHHTKAERGSRPNFRLDEELRKAKSPLAVVYHLLGTPHLWWTCCRDATSSDPEWYDEQGAQLRSWILATAPDDTIDPTSLTDLPWLIGRMLRADAGTQPDAALADLASRWRHSGLLISDAALGPARPSGKGLHHLPPDVAERLNSLIGRIEALEAQAANSGANGMLVIAALLLAGAPVRERPTVRLTVVFERSGDTNAPEEGTTGVLELREFPAGPAGLYPDPRTMAGTRTSNRQFAHALGDAWDTVKPWSRGRCVLWRLILDDDPMPAARVSGPSLSAAFALGLRELLRHTPSRLSGRARLRAALYGFRPRTAVTGALTDGERLAKVAGMNAKLLAAHRKGLRLIAPEENRLDTVKAPAPGAIVFAATLRQADRKARMLRVGRLSAALVTVAALGATGVAMLARQDAAISQRAVLAHRLADVSRSLLTSDVATARLFAARAWQTTPDSVTRAALFQAMTTNPSLVGAVQTGGKVSALASSSNGTTGVSGTANGLIERWTIEGTRIGSLVRLGRIKGPVRGVAIDADGDTIVATDGRTVHGWAKGMPIDPVALPPGQLPTAVAVSQSGRFVAVTTTPGKYGVPRRLTLLDRSTSQTSSHALFSNGDQKAVAFSGESQVVVLENVFGAWDRISLRTMRSKGRGEASFAIRNHASALAPDGSYLTYTHGDADLSVWQAKGRPKIGQASRIAKVDPGDLDITALALSHGGARIAEAIGTRIVVAQVTAPGAKETTPAVSLLGTGAVERGALTFASKDGTRLLSASGDRVSLWDTKRRSAISASSTAVTIPFGCMACDEPFIAVSPDNRHAVVLGAGGFGLGILRMHPFGPLRSESGTWPDASEYAAATWHPNGDLLLTFTDGGARILSPDRGFQVTGTWQAPSPPSPDADVTVGAEAIQFHPDGQRVVEVTNSGVIRVRNASNGTVLQVLQGVGRVTDTRSAGVAMDAEIKHVAIVDNDGERVVVTDMVTAQTREIPVPPLTRIAYADDRLLIQRLGGAWEIWSASGDRRIDTIDGTPYTGAGPAVGTGLIASKGVDDTLLLADVSSGQFLGSLPLPPGDRPSSTGLGFSPDGNILLTATEGSLPDGNSGVVLAWNLDPNAWAAVACTTASRHLTPELWRHYVDEEPPPDLQCR